MSVFLQGDDESAIPLSAEEREWCHAHPLVPQAANVLARLRDYTSLETPDRLLALKEAIAAFRAVRPRPRFVPDSIYAYIGITALGDEMVMAMPEITEVPLPRGGTKQVMAVRPMIGHDLDRMRQLKDTIDAARAQGRSIKLVRFARAEEVDDSAL